MDSIFDYFQKNWVLSLLLIVVLGYFLGITISTTVDYRLRDAVIQMPTPKQTIIVHMDSKKTNEPFKDDNQDSHVGNDSDDKPSKPVKRRRPSNNAPTTTDLPVYESFMNQPRVSNPADDEFIPSSSYASSSYKDIPDTAQRAYALSYQIAESISKYPFPFKAHNTDDANQQYTKFVTK